MNFDIEKILLFSEEQIIFEADVGKFCYKKEDAIFSFENNATISTKNHTISLSQLESKINRLYKKFKKKTKWKQNNIIPNIVIQNQQSLAQISNQSGTVNIFLSKEIFYYKLEEILFIIAHELAHLKQWIDNEEDNLKYMVHILDKYLGPSIKILSISGGFFAFNKYQNLITSHFHPEYNSDLQITLLYILLGFLYYYLYEGLNLLQYLLSKKILHSLEYHADDISIKLTGSPDDAINFFKKQVPQTSSYSHPGTLERIKKIKTKKIIYKIFYPSL